MSDSLTTQKTDPSTSRTAQTTNRRPEPAMLPPVDVIEDATGIVLWADLPGVPRDQVHVRVESDTLTLEGDVQVAMPPGLDASHVELQMPRWRRTFTLSKELDTSKVQAECRDGVLQVRIPKAEHAQPRRIDVRVG
jgi:HSP20 family molecular chaperone IbpA